MKWIKGILVLGMVMFAYSTISISDVEARGKTKQTRQSGKKTPKNKGAKKNTGAKGSRKNKGGKNSGKATANAQPAKAPKEKKGGFFASLKAGFSSLGSKLSNSVNCRAGKGEAPGKALFDMAMSGERLSDAHVVTAHASPSKAGRKR
jgi:hypothetical protein